MFCGTCPLSDFPLEVSRGKKSFFSHIFLKRRPWANDCGNNPDLRIFSRAFAMTRPLKSTIMKTTRRSALKTASLLAAGAALGSRLQAADAQMKGRVNHSVCKWCYPKNSIEELC